MSITPSPVCGDELTEPQLLGRACVWCKAAIGPGGREHVGFIGHPVWLLYACPKCAAVKRLPSWPEYGAC